MLSYGDSALVKVVTGDLFSDLLDVFDAGEAYAIMSMATLKVVKPGITANRMSTHYRRTFVCRDYPGASLSQNSVTDLLQRIGQDGGKRKRFYRLRLSQVAADHHIAVDGTLKTDAPAVPKSDDGYWVHTLQCVFEELEALGLSEPEPKPEPKKRGRKPKPKDPDPKPKRPRGRPRKEASQSVGSL